MAIGPVFSIICTPPRDRQIGPQNRTMVQGPAGLVTKKAHASHLRTPIQQPPRSEYSRAPIRPRNSVEAIEIPYLYEDGSPSDCLHTYGKVCEYCATPRYCRLWKRVYSYRTLSVDNFLIKPLDRELVWWTGWAGLDRGVRRAYEG